MTNENESSNLISEEMSDLQQALESNEHMDFYLETKKTADIIKEIKEYSNVDRNKYAAMAMQGLCASGFYTDKKIQSICEDIGSAITAVLAVAATDIADGLIAELNREKK